MVRPSLDCLCCLMRPQPLRMLKRANPAELLFHSLFRYLLVVGELIVSISKISFDTGASAAKLPAAVRVRMCKARQSLRFLGSVQTLKASACQVNQCRSNVNEGVAERYFVCESLPNATSLLGIWLETMPGQACAAVIFSRNLCIVSFCFGATGSMLSQD